MNKTFSRMSCFMDRHENTHNWLDADEETQRQEFISELFSKNSPKKRQRLDSVHESDCSGISPSELLNASHDQINEDELPVEPKFEEHPDSDCEGDSEFESFFEPSSHVSSDPWLDESPSVKPQPISIPLSSSLSISKPNVESKEPIGGDASASANSKRRDVCIKSILRSMRRFYCAKLETMTPYLRKEKKIKLKHQTLIKCTKQIVEDLGLDKFGPNMAFYFALFAYSCDMRKILEKSKATFYLCANSEIDVPLINKAIQIINLIENALNRFSKKIFNKLIDIPEIAYMIQHFLAQNPESLENTREYEECIQILDEKSSEVLSSIGDVSRAKARNDYYITEPFFLFLGNN